MKNFLLIVAAYFCGGICVTLYFQPQIIKLQRNVNGTNDRLSKIDSSLQSNAALRKSAIEDRARMNVKLDSVLRNQEEVKIWHYQGLVRSIQNQVKIDSINAKLTKKIRK